MLRLSITFFWIIRMRSITSPNRILYSIYIFFFRSFSLVPVVFKVTTLVIIIIQTSVKINRTTKMRLGFFYHFYRYRKSFFKNNIIWKLLMFVSYFPTSRYGIWELRDMTSIRMFRTYRWWHLPFTNHKKVYLLHYYSSDFYCKLFVLHFPFSILLRFFFLLIFFY